MNLQSLPPRAGTSCESPGPRPAPPTRRTRQRPAEDLAYHAQTPLLPLVRQRQLAKAIHARHIPDPNRMMGSLLRILVVWPDQAEALAEIPLETRHFRDLGRYLLEPMIERVRVAEQHAGELLGGRTVWVVNSTALGGGVAQLLRTLLPYWKGAGIDVRWVVLRGSGEFFRVTKRFHNHLQGQSGDGHVLGIDELRILDQAARQHAGVLASQLAKGQTLLSLTTPRRQRCRCRWRGRARTSFGAVTWASTVTTSSPERVEVPEAGPAGVQRFVFSRCTSLPEWLGGAETSILTPGIDPASTKNLPMSEDAARAILQHLGLAAGVSAATPRATSARMGRSRRSQLVPRSLHSDGAPDWQPGPSRVLLARWDRIKDPLGILDGFLERALAASDAHLLLAGPDAEPGRR